jgi:hypothetical protein
MPTHGLSKRSGTISVKVLVQDVSVSSGSTSLVVSAQFPYLAFLSVTNGFLLFVLGKTKR